MFEIDQNYKNRRGEYTVVEVNPPKMRVRYLDGEEADLNMEIQARIWENIRAEEEAQAASAAARQRRAASKSRYFIKTMSLLSPEDLSVVGLRQRVTAARKSVAEMRPDDRLIYYAIEPRAFFAVATITGFPRSSPAKGYFKQTEEGEEILLYPIDVDAQALALDQAVPLDSVELESQPEFKRLLREADIYLPINEDDFELLAELLTEVAEDDDEDEFEDEEEDEEDYLE